jgi:hypothetical protein
MNGRFGRHFEGAVGGQGLFYLGGGAVDDDRLAASAGPPRGKSSESDGTGLGTQPADPSFALQVRWHQLMSR